MERLAQKGIVDRPMRLPPPPKRPVPAPPSKQGAPLPGGKLLPPRPRQGGFGTNPRVRRDGKPREASKDETQPLEARAQTSPALQNIPRLKGAAPGRTHAGRGGGPPPA